MEPGATNARRSRRGVVLIAVLAVVVVAAIAALIVSQRDDSHSPASPTRGAPPAERVAKLSGTGDQTTKSFQVKKGWEIRWATTGTTFKFAITGDRDFGTVVDHQGAGGGSTYPIGSGTFRLQVSADGPWTVRIVDHSS